MYEILKQNSQQSFPNKWFQTFPLLESNIAMGFVFENLAKMMIRITVIGTLTTIPMIPQMVPQTAKASTATSGLIFKESPMIFGSMKLEMRV